MMDEGIIPTNGPNRKIPCSPWGFTYLQTHAAAEYSKCVG